MTSDRPSEETNAPSRRALLSSIASAGTAVGLAGCSDLMEEGEEPTRFEAVPAVLGEPGQEILGLTEFAIEEQTKTVSPSEATAEVEATSYLAVHSRPGEDEPPMRFGVPDPTARTFGVLSMPSPEGLGQAVNPLASEPLGELLGGEQGRKLLAQAGAVDAPAFDWRRQPERIGTREVEVLGTATEAQSFMGVAVGEGPARTIVANLARVHHEGSVVLMGEFTWRRTPNAPLDVPGNCIDGLCQFLDPMQVDMWRRYQRAIEYLATCTEMPVNGNVIEVCGGGGGGGEDKPDPKFGITNVRYVQQVEDTVVKTPGGSPTHTEPDPDLVEGEKTAVVFEFDQLENLDQMGEPLEITIYRGHTAPGNSRSFKYSDTFEIPISDLEKIDNGNEHTISVLHRLANDGSSDNDLPVFELEASPVAVVTASNVLRFDFWEKISEHPDDVRTVEPLKVGFIQLQDKDGGSRYGNNNGRPRDFWRSFQSATEYLQRTYPGDVVTYGHTRHAIGGKHEVTGAFKRNCTDSCVVYRDMKKTKKQLNRMATDSSYPPSGPGFPNGGTLHLDGRDRATMVNEIQNDGFDAVVAIVPGIAPNNGGANDYYNFFGFSTSTNGLAFDDPAAAVSSQGANPSNGDPGLSATVAQEIGHYFQDDYLSPSGHPMAQRRNDSSDNNQPTVNGKQLDPAHARHQNSNGVSGGDAPGVVSTAYDLEDGFANVQHYTNAGGSFGDDGPGWAGTSITDVGKIESYMSYTGQSDRTWADARIHQQLIDSGWNANGTSGSSEARFMLTADGYVADDGTIEYGEVEALPGIDEHLDREGAPVEVELLDWEGRVLQSARVPVVVETSHHEGHVGEKIELPSFALPFDDRCVEVRTTYDGASIMNPIDRSVRDAVRRVPERGFHGESEAALEAVGEALDEVAATMDERRYGEAAELMDDVVRERIEERVGEYEGTLDEPTLPELLGLVDEMVRRLQVIAETAG